MSMFGELVSMECLIKLLCGMFGNIAGEIGSMVLCRFWVDWLLNWYTTAVNVGRVVDEFGMV